MKTTAFANELTKIAIARPSIMRGFEALTGAAVGAAAGIGYVRATGKTKGWDDEESAGTLAGAVTGVGAALLASHGIRSASVRRAMKRFKGTKRFMDSASLLAEGSSVMSRPALIRKQIEAVDTHDVFPQYFRKALEEAGVTPKKLDELLGFGKKERSLLAEHQRVTKLMRNKNRVALDMANRGLLPSRRIDDQIANFQARLNDLDLSLERARKSFRAGKDIQQHARERSQDWMTRSRANAALGLESAKAQVKDLQAGHKKMVAEALAASRAGSSRKYFGIL
jgi:hypothetical protein